MASRYWVVNGAGNWSDTTHWSTTSGGSGGSAAPTSSDDVFFDANSGASGIVTIDVGSENCNNLDFTGFLNNRIVNVNSNTLNINGSLTLRSQGNALLQVGTVRFVGSGSITTNTNQLSVTPIIINSSGAYTLQDSFTCPSGVNFQVQGGTFNTNGNSMNVSTFVLSNSPTVSLGGSIITLTTTGGNAFVVTSGATFNAGTSGVFFTAGGAGDGSGIPIIDLNSQTAYDIQFNAATSFFSGNNHFRFKSTGTLFQLDVSPGQVFKGVAGITITTTNCNLGATVANPITIQSETNGSNWTLGTSNFNTSQTVVVKDCTVAACSAIQIDKCTSNCTGFKVGGRPAAASATPGIITALL